MAESIPSSKLAECRKKFLEFMTKLNTWVLPKGISQPVPPPFLKYKYPAPTRVTLLRIAMQMKKVPAFYTQVLHLMNKMNLPPPFEGLEEEFPIIKEAYDIENYQDLFGVREESSKVPEEQEKQDERPEPQLQEESMDEDESEIESENEGKSIQEVIPMKRKKMQPKKPVKIPKFVNPLKQAAMVGASTSQKPMKPEDVFDLHSRKPASQKITLTSVESRNKSLKTSGNTEEQVVIPNASAEGFGLILPAKATEQKEKEESPEQQFISTEQLHENRISTYDQRVLPIFNNYHPGKPSYRLYIKNLSKQVEEKDLHFIYRRYVLPSVSSDQQEYHIRLMQEGRMKGQAFVTLPNVAQAQLALEETNGYILKDKPMVVQFAKISRT